MRLVSAEELRSSMTWEKAIGALWRGHLGTGPIVQDILLQDGAFSLLGRGVVMPGYGAGMKIAAIHPPNVGRDPPQRSEHAVFVVIGEDSKRIEMIVDGPELTRWKTAADSALAARLLSREDCKTLLIIGAGPIASALCEAHLSVRPGISRVLLWNRTPGRLKPLLEHVLRTGRSAQIVENLTEALPHADIISAATASTTALVTSTEVSPGCHVDLVGGFTSEMREADDALMSRAQVYVNCRATTVEQVGDICGPIRGGAIGPDDIRGDLFDLVAHPPRRSAQDVTVYKNGGGAHIDLLVASTLL